MLVHESVLPGEALASERRARFALTSAQKPHPASGSRSRAEAPSDGLRLSATGLSWGPSRGGSTPASSLLNTKEALEALGKDPAGRIGAHCSIANASDRETAITEAREIAAKKAGVYASFNMQEDTTVDLGLGGQRELQDWAVSGSPQDSAEIINRCHEEDGLNYIGLASLNSPSDFSARLDYLQLNSEELIPRLQRRGQVSVPASVRQGKDSGIAGRVVRWQPGC